MAKKKTVKKTGPVTPIETIEHQDKRPLIPTEETQKFMRDEDRAETKTLYPRDPSLDPQLVWKGKDQQDAGDLEVPALPIYIQEVIKPQAIIEDIRSRADVEDEADQLDLFADEAAGDLSQKLNFYEHQTGWKNRMILGDSLLVLNSLAEKEQLKGQVQMIFLDPPYGIKFGSNWQVSTRKRDVKDGSVTDATRQPEQVKAFRDTWELGIHSYLAYLRDRLTVARELLTESGSIFVQIGEENVHLVRCLLDEVFGCENFISQIIFRTKIPLGTTYLAGIADHILWYGKERSHTKYRKIYTSRDAGGGTQFTMLQSDLIRRRLTSEEKNEPDFSKIPGRLFRQTDLVSAGRTESCVFSFSLQNQTYFPTGGKSWKTNPLGMERLIRADRIMATGKTPSYVFFLEDYPVQELPNVWLDTQGAAGKTYVVQTADKPIQRCLLMTTDPGDLVLDPTCGSGTTAFVAEQWGRRWITIDTSRVALTLARTRLMSGKFPYYLLADSPAGQQQEAKIAGQPQPVTPTRNDIRQGFVYERVPHITLGKISNNEEIDTIHEKWQQQLEPLRQRINQGFGQRWEEWEIPREAPAGADRKKSDMLNDWWNLRRKRQQEMDESISRRADQELLYDKPYEDKKTIRVAGPFTVESLSPHRRLSVQEKINKRSAVPGTKVPPTGPDDFGNMIIENLRKAGVQNQVKEERLQWDRLEAYAGEWIHAQGEYTDKSNKQKRVAVCIGPEHGTVGPELINEAAKEAMKGIGHDLLLVCGFAFDPLADRKPGTMAS